MNSCIFVNGVEIHKFQIKDSEINAATLCLDYISKNVLVDKMKQTELYECL